MTAKPNVITPEELAATRERAGKALIYPWDRVLTRSGETLVKTDIPRLLDALEAAYDREAKMVAALRAISEESTDLGARECADEALEELGYGKEDAE